MEIVKIASGKLTESQRNQKQAISLVKAGKQHLLIQILKTPFSSEPGRFPTKKVQVLASSVILCVATLRRK